MSTTTFDSYSDSGGDEISRYRAIHAGAIVGVVLGVLSVFVLISAASSFEACLLITPIPVLGMFIALRCHYRTHFLMAALDCTASGCSSAPGGKS